MQRLDDDIRAKIYKVIQCLYHRDGKECTALEVTAIQDNVEFKVFRVVTKFSNSVGIMDFQYKDDYVNDDNGRGYDVVQEWTIDIPNTIFEEILLNFTNETELLSNFALIKLIKEAKIEDAHKLQKWFIKSITIDELLKKYDAIDDTGHIVEPEEPSEITREATQAEIEAEENNDIEIGGSYE